jgi:hypothetical protein
MPRKPQAVRTQPSHQTAKANSVPRLGQGLRSPYQRMIRRQRQMNGYTSVRPDYRYGRSPIQRQDPLRSK